LRPSRLMIKFILTTVLCAANDGKCFLLPLFLSSKSFTFKRVSCNWATRSQFFHFSHFHVKSHVAREEQKSESVVWVTKRKKIFHVYKQKCENDVIDLWGTALFCLTNSFWVKRVKRDVKYSFKSILKGLLFTLSTIC
jgi:hypothetical protein